MSVLTVTIGKISCWDVSRKVYPSISRDMVADFVNMEKCISWNLKQAKGSNYKTGFSFER